MHNCEDVPTSMASTIAFQEFADDSLVDDSLYRRIICKFYYISFTRLYIAFEVRKLSQSMHQSLLSHWADMKHLLWYLHHTSSFGLRIAKEHDHHFLNYSDSNSA